MVWVVPLVVLYAALDRGGADPAIKELLSLLFWGMAALVLAGVREFRVPPIWVVVLWLSVWLWGIATFAVTWSPDATLAWAVQFGALLAFAFFVYATAQKPPPAFYRMLALGFAVVLAVGYVFLILAKTGVFIGRHDMMLHFISTFYWKNPAAGYILLFLPFVFSLSVVEISRGWRVFFAFVSVLAFGALLLTRSRGGWVAGFFAAVVGVVAATKFIPRIWRRALLVFALGAILAFLVMPPGWVVSRIVKIEEVAKRKPEEPVQERRMMLAMGARVVSEFPLMGVGMGAFKIAYPHFLKSSHYLSTHLHSQYLQFAVEGGVPAAILFVAAVFSVVFAMLFAAFRRGDIVLWGMATGALAYALHIAVDFDWDFWGTTLPFLVFLAAGARRMWPQGVRVFGLWRAASAAAVVAGFLLATALAVAGAVFDQYQAQARRSAQESLIRVCTTLNPLSARYWYERAGVVAGGASALRCLEKALKLEPRNVFLQYAYGFLIWNDDRPRAVEVLRKAVGFAPYVLPNLQLRFAQKAKEAGLIGVAKDVFEGITKHFSTNPNTRYNDRTAGFRYIVARALTGLGDIYYESGDFAKADSLYRLAHILGCPRYEDKLAKIWAMDIISPEQTVAEMIDAVNVGDTLRAWSYIADSARIRLSEGTELYLAQVMDVKQDMLSERASVDVLLLRAKGRQVFWELAFFDLILTDDGWKVVFKF